MKDFKHWSKNSDSLVIPPIIFYISQDLCYDLHKDFGISRNSTVRMFFSPPLFAAVQWESLSILYSL